MHEIPPKRRGVHAPLFDFVAMPLWIRRIRHFVLLGRVSPLLRARKVSAGAGFAASVVPCATTVANSAITDGNVRRLQKPVCDRHRIDERTEPHVPS